MFRGGHVGTKCGPAGPRTRRTPESRLKHQVAGVPYANGTPRRSLLKHQVADVLCANGTPRRFLRGVFGPAGSALLISAAHCHREMGDNQAGLPW